MSRNLIVIPPDAANPDWAMLPDEDGLMVMKVQVEPQQVAGIKLNNTVLSAGRISFFVRKAERLPEKPTQAPLQPYKVWCDRILDT